MKALKLFDFRNIVKVIAAGAGIYLCLRYASECSRGILNGILFCIQVLVPSLFVFMALAAAIVKSGAAEIIARPLGGVSRILFRLPSPALAAILLAMVGGYPVGARCAEMLYEQGRLSAGDAEKTAYIAVCAGPGFLLNFVGRTLLGSPDAGLILLLSQLMSTVLTGVIVGRAVKRKSALHNDGFPRSALNQSKQSLSHRAIPTTSPSTKGSLMIDAVRDASRATFHMCAMVVICAAMIEVVTAVSPDRRVTDIASALIEITTGCGMLCGRYPLAFIAFFIGFGGISVHLQIYAGCSKIQLNKGLFFLFRIIQGIITAALTYIYLMIFPIEVTVFNSADVPLTAAKSATLVGSAALVISALCFIGSLHKNALRR